MGSGFIYKWYDKCSGMIYIGKHEGQLDDGYICDSPDMLFDFVRTILWHSTHTFPSELKQKETYYLFLRNAAEMFGGSYRQPFPNEVKISVGKSMPYSIQYKKG